MKITSKPSFSLENMENSFTLDQAPHLQKDACAVAGLFARVETDHNLNFPREKRPGFLFLYLG
ncbi:MAG: hypothetical protein ACREGC_03225 [Minisyncoccia bacterium]